jgi:hypothetical protein
MANDPRVDTSGDGFVRAQHANGGPVLIDARRVMLLRPAIGEGTILLLAGGGEVTVTATMDRVHRAVGEARTQGPG